MPRKASEQLEFGSDSFLDVVANIVGILIILIVVAGVRVSRAPARPPALAPQPVAFLTTVEAMLPSPAPIPVVLKTEENVPRVSALPDPPVIVPRELPPVPTFGPLPAVTEPGELLDRTRELETNAAVLADRVAKAQGLLAQKDSTRTQIETEIAAINEKLSVQAATVRQHRLNTAFGEQSINDLETAVASLRKRLEEQSAETTERKTLTHRLPPIGRTVTGDELHFRLAGNRVSYVPVMELANRVKAEMERRKEMLLNRPFFQGTVGPIDGYLMDYMLQRESLSLVEEMRIGRSAVRIGLTGWVLSPTPEMIPESADQALLPNSRFLEHLSRANPSSTITFWVYPDSFEAHSRLKSYIHELGLWVASRPLPDGVPIAGSPQGSKSLAQ